MLNGVQIEQHQNQSKAWAQNLYLQGHKETPQSNYPELRSAGDFCTSKDGG